MFSNNLPVLNSKIFECKKCNFKSCNKKDFKRHNNTKKHNNNENQGFLNENTQENPSKYSCQCGKNYMDNSGLWRHKKKCKILIEDEKKSEESETELVKYLMKENSELKNMILEVCKSNKANTTIYNGDMNSHNKTFNLNVFLNETCKDALNLTDFIESLKLQLCDLERIGELGFVNGISEIIIKNLKALDVTVRPVHCSDSKREVMYVKEDNKWEKEDESNTKLKKAIKKVANKNLMLLQDFKEKYPDCIYSDSKKSDQYNKIIVEASELYDVEKQEKIIKKIAKEVVINKHD